MADPTTTVCTMCGDVGFHDKLFRCMRCLSRFQHSYCSNFYTEDPSKPPSVCDWCLSEERSRRSKHFKKPSVAVKCPGPSSKNKQESEPEERGGNWGKSTSSGSSSKPAGRRYKLLKDVLC